MKQFTEVRAAEQPENIKQPTMTPRAAHELNEGLKAYDHANNAALGALRELNRLLSQIRAAEKRLDERLADLERVAKQYRETIARSHGIRLNQ